MGKKGKKGKGKAPPAEETPAFLLDLDTVYVRTSKTQLKVQPKAELINEPPNMNMSMGLDAATGKQLFTVHYKKPIVPPSLADASVETERPKLLYVKPAEIIARYTSLTDEDDALPMILNVPQEGKYVVDDEPKILKYNQTHLKDSDESLVEDSDDNIEMPAT
ncbi:uncharacterized protein LOC103515289 isoform X1 [Diaphorina citri]|uniref:Uncharacterized protein LOC103515289 isoform X1 n=2 Tax=Diaphorina citri TaxID=121845 RepID=A0A1S3DBS4_DIACI|nr:uncharacterized protein LOC103515289 isoform X2 [Diaphorina citri]XP_008478445.1 uncharacterized protein LOC103515289 isoform X1 [Diaphorina citri]